jgi:hypothetical protein
VFNEATMRRAITIIVTICIFAVLISGWRPWQQGLAGTWIKKSGSGRWPDQITFQHDAHSLTLRYFEGGGRTTVTAVCDGTEHKVRDDYWLRAQCDKQSLVLTTRTTLTQSTERWQATARGTSLVVSDGSNETRYRRPSVLQRMVIGTP